MKNKDFHKLIEKPHLIDEKHIKELDNIINDNPYFASARLLKIIDLIKHKSPKVYEEIRKSSLYIHDKNSIYDELLNTDIPESNPATPDISKGPVGIGLGENRIEKNDFTNEILDEITIIGKGVKATVLESFIENNTEEAQDSENNNKTQDVKQQEKKQEAKAETKPHSSTKTLTDKKETSDKTSSVSPKRSLADEVMESLAEMKKEREERQKKMEALGVKISKNPSTDSTKEKTENKSSLKAKKEETPTKKKSSSKAVKSKKQAESKERDSKTKTKAKPKDTKKKPEKQEEKKVSQAKVKSDQKIIETFINKNPRIKPPKDSESNQSREDLSKPSTELPSNLVSENLANIFEKQGKISKAIAIYKQLILKYPEKKSYFAQKLETLEK